MMYYTVQHKAAANAVAYLASIPAHEMDNARRLDQAQAVTEWIVAETVSDFRMGYHGGHGVVVICDGGPCISSGDSYVTVSAGAIAFDEDFSWWSWPVVDPYEGIIIRAHVTLPYHGK